MPRPQPRRGDALVVVDPQVDFLPGGALPAPHGDAALAALVPWIAAFRDADLPLFITRDWHPPDHISFVSRGGPWPPHCIAGTPGAEFAPDLDVPGEAAIVSKGQDRDLEAYSGFEGTELDDFLRDAEVRRVFVGGLTTEFCVLNTVRDAVRLGYDVMLLEDAVRAVDEGAGAKALAEMRRLGARPVRVERVAR